jgi:chitodextrinase
MNRQYASTPAASALAKMVVLASFLAVVFGASPVSALGDRVSPVFGSSTSSAFRDRVAPTAPSNLRVTGKTAFSVSLAWNPSSDNSGSFSYVVRASNGKSALVSQSATAFTFTDGLQSRMSYTFHVYAVDAAGNKSKNSNTVSAVLPADTIPPTAPVLVVTDVGATHVSLLWSAQEDGPWIFYQIYLNGAPHLYAGSATSATVAGLDPSITYTFTVIARDNGINYSPASNEVTVTTEAPDASDVTPPTTPASLSASDLNSGDGEISLHWTQSTDDQTPQAFIKYEIVLNGVLDHRLVGYGRTSVYGTFGIVNTIEVFAIDEAGNRSAPATQTVVLR